MPHPPVQLESFNLAAAEAALVRAALAAVGNSLVEAAELLGIDRHALKRRIVKHRIPFPRRFVHGRVYPEDAEATA